MNNLKIHKKGGSSFMLKNKFSTLILLILFLANTIIFCTVANLVQVNDLLTEGSTSLSSSFENFKETSSFSSDSVEPHSPNWITKNMVWTVPSTLVGVTGIITAFAL